MAVQNKIEQYNLQDRVLELKGQGSTQVEIGEIVTQELKERGIDDGITQSTVQRFLKRAKDERSEEAGQIVRDYTRGSVPRDLEIIEEVQSFLLNIKRNLKKDPESGKLVDAGIELRNQVYAAVSLARVTFDKLRNLGALKAPRGADGTNETDGNTDNKQPSVPSGSNIRSIADRFGVGKGTGTTGNTS